MKRIICVLMFVGIIITTFSCNLKNGGVNEAQTTEDNATNTTTESNTEEGSTEQNDTPIPQDAVVSTWMSEGFNKVYGHTKAPQNAPKSFSLSAAKNESETVHISVRISESVSGLTFELTEGVASGVTVEMFEEMLVKTGSIMSPDPIIPFDGDFDVEKDVSKSILIRFNVSKTAKAGSYTYKFVLKDSAGNKVEEFTVDLKLWGFELPDAPSCETAGDIDENELRNKEQVTMAALKKTHYKAYYDLLLSYKFVPHDLPYDILDERADAYMSDPRVTRFRVDYAASDEKLLQIYEKLKSNPVWLEKAYFYPYDEPHTKEGLDIMAQRTERVRELCPDIDVLVAFYTNIRYDNNRDQIDYMTDYLDIFCVKSALWSPGMLSDPHKRGYLGDRMNALKEEGNKIWWYVCWEPGNPFCNLFVDEIGIQHRELFWQQYLYEVEGFLYWSVNSWTTTDDPWTVTPLSRPGGAYVYGDGCLLYPGKNVGVDGPVASLRLDCIRDGVEDFDLLKLAEEHLGREWVTAQVKKVSESVTVHTKDNSLFVSVRNAIGEALNDKLSK